MTDYQFVITQKAFVMICTKKHFCLSKLPKQNLNGGIYIYNNIIIRLYINNRVYIGDC